MKTNWQDTKDENKDIIFYNKKSLKMNILQQLCEGVIVPVMMPLKRGAENDNT